MLELFLTFVKIGLFTFGGGYGMISLVKDECIDNKKWVTNEEFVNLLAVAESTPGPVAINMASYVGYRRGKLLGAAIATFGAVLPSIVIIYIISLFIDKFLTIKIISDAFFGIRIAVAFIIVRTAYNLIKEEHKTSKIKLMTILLFLCYVILLFVLDLFSVNVQSFVLIIIAIMIGILLDIILIRKNFNIM